MGENTEIPLSNDVIQVIGHVTRDEIMSLRISIANKRLIVAICENDRGRYIKLTDGRARIIVPSDGISHMREALTMLESNLDPSQPLDDSSTSIPPQGQTSSVSSPAPSSGSTATTAAAAVANAAQQHHQQQQQHTQPASGASTNNVTNNANNASGNGGGNEEHRSELIDSQRFLCEGRKFYFDILDNSRGRYLKISQSSTRRITLIVPLAFLPSIKRAIDMLLEKAPPDTTIQDPSTVQRITRSLERVTALGDGSSVTLNIVQREVRTMGKRVVFESGANRRGSYIKIMENNGAQRMAVMLPHAAVPEIIHLLQEVVADGDPAQALNPPNGQ